MAWGRAKEPKISFAELNGQIQKAAFAAIDYNRVLNAPPVPKKSAAPNHRPSTWDSYVGQTRVRHRLKVAVRSALARDERAEHMLITSGPGSGKTTLAELIARLMDRPLVVLTKPPTSEQFLRACQKAEFGVLFIDEIHCWNDKIQHELMQLTESETVDTRFGPQYFPMLTVIAATTEADKLLKPLVSRFPCQVDLDPYTDYEMTEIAHGMVERCWPREYDPLGHETLAILAVAAAGVPRNLRSLIFAARDLAMADEDVSAFEILSLCDTDPDGCTRAHLNLLGQLANSPTGTIGLNNLAMSLRVAPDMVRDTERLLVDRGYILHASNGRTITQPGRARFNAGSIRDAA